jgi:hypothetical protein
MALHALRTRVGLAVTPIHARSDRRSADLRAAGAKNGYVIEVKCREEDRERARARRARLSLGEVVGESEGLARKNAVSGIIADAAEQLAADATDADVRVLWLHLEGFSAERDYHQFRNTLYGSTHIIDIDQDAKWECLYFRDSDFFRYRQQLDGAVILQMQSVDTRLAEATVYCLANDLSPRYKSFIESELFRAFPVGAFDPREAERVGEALIVRGNVDRRDAEAVLAYLRGATGRARLINMDLSIWTASIAVGR